MPVHVVAEPSAAAAVIPHRTDVSLDEGIELVGYDLAQQGDETALTLYWRAAQPPPRDYQVFVHLLDANGSQIACADGPPVEEFYPTSQWLPGQIIADRHRISGADDPATVALRVGLYDLTTMQRLAIVDAGRAVTSDDAILLPLPQDGAD